MRKILTRVANIAIINVVLVQNTSLFNFRVHSHYVYILYIRTLQKLLTLINTYESITCFDGGKVMGGDGCV